MSSNQKIIGGKIVVKDPTKSAKNYKCKINSAKLRKKKLDQYSVAGLLAHNQEKREKSDLRKQKMVESINSSRLTGAHAGHKRLNEVEEELRLMKHNLEEKDSQIKTERNIRQEYQYELREANIKVASLEEELRKALKEKASLWDLIRQQQKSLNSLKRV